MDEPRELSPGRLLPEALLRARLKHCGQRVKIYAGCRVFPAEHLSVGDDSQIDEGVWIFAGEGVSIGRHVHLAFGCSISGGGRCEIDDFAGFGAGVRLLTGTEEIGGDGLTNPTIPSAFRAVRRGKIFVGAHALVFTNSIVWPDVTIGEGAIVAAGSVVHHDLKPWGIYAGNPLVQVGVRPKEIILDQARRLLAEDAAGAVPPR